MPDGSRISGKRLLARMSWELATTGKATFPDGRVLEVEPVDWLALIKWIYQHIDGPPRAEVDLNSDSVQHIIIEYADETASGPDQD